jgi:hypothetical protein
VTNCKPVGDAPVAGIAVEIANDAGSPPTVDIC